MKKDTPRGSGRGVEFSSSLNELQIGKAEVLREGRDVCFWAIGSMVENAEKAADLLQECGIDAGVVNMRFAKPLDENLLKEHAKRYKYIVTLEEGVLSGGVGSAVLESLNSAGLLPNCRVLNLGIPDAFIPQGDKKYLLRDLGLDAASVAEQTKRFVKGEDR